MKTKSKVSNINHLSVEEFNKLYPIGTKVKYYPVYSFPEFEITETDSKAYEMCRIKNQGVHRIVKCIDFEKPENFIKLLELNIKEYNKTLVNLATPYFVFNNRKSLLSLIVNSFKNNTQFARFYFKDIKQAIKSEEWVYG